MKKALLSIFVTVAASILIFVIKQHLQKPESTTISVNGQVLEKSANASRLLENVLVRVHCQSVNETQNSDSLGRFAFSLDGFKATTVGSISAQAPGYGPVTYNMSLQEMTGLRTIYLEATPSPPGNPANERPVVSHPAATQYIVRPDIKRLSAYVRHAN